MCIDPSQTLPFAFSSKIMASPPPTAQDVIEYRKALIQHTWRVIEKSLNVEATRIFYREFLAQYPDFLPLFAHTNMETQAQKVYEVLRVAVRFLNHIDDFSPVLKDIGVRHARAYCVQRHHYHAATYVFVDVINEILECKLGDDSNSYVDKNALCKIEVASAWSWLLNLIWNIMADAADEDAAARAVKKEAHDQPSMEWAAAAEGGEETSSITPTVVSSSVS